MKLKGDEYLRLHRIVTNFSTRSIWEILMYGEDLEPFLERVPDEFDTWVKEVVKDLQTRYDNIRNDYAEITIDLMNKVGFEDKKAFAELALLYPHNSILFSMYNGKLDCMNEYIWKLLKPKYEKAFSSDESI
jgi:RNA ligase